MAEKTPEQIAEEEAKKAAAAEKKAAEKAAKEAEKAANEAPKRVEIFIPRGAEGEGSLFVSVNGVNYLLPRGKKSVVPLAVAEEVKRAWEAQETADKKKDELLSQ